MKRLIMLPLAAAGFLVISSPAHAETVSAFVPAAEATPGVWFESDVRTGGTAAVVDLTGAGGDLETNQPLPHGAAKITTDATNAAKAEVAIGNTFGHPSDIFATIAVSYSWLKAANVGQNPNAAPSMKLTFYNPVCDETVGADCYATLVYEPYENGFGNFPTQDQWQRSELNANTGGWWSTGGFGQPNMGGGCGGACKTLAEWLSSSTADFAQANLVSVSIGVGSYNPGQIGYFDNVVISGTAADGTYDFEPAPQFETVGECVSTLIAEYCAEQKGRDRANCNHAQQMTCFDLFGVP